MSETVTKTSEKPVLDAESFQCLLAAAFMLQAHNDASHPVAAAGASPHPLTPVAIVQERTLSLRRKPGVQLSLAREIVQPTRPMVWMTVEALAISTVFCMMVGMSILSASSSGPSLRSEAVQSGRSLPAVVEQRTARPSPTSMAKALPMSSQPVVTLNSQPSTDDKADVVAKDFVIRYQKRAVDPGANKLAHGPAPTLRSRTETRTLQPVVRFTFGKDTDTLAADTVERHGAAGR